MLVDAVFNCCGIYARLPTQPYLAYEVQLLSSLGRDASHLLTAYLSVCGGWKAANMQPGGKAT